MDACCRPFEWQSYADERAVQSSGEQGPQVDSREAQRAFSLAGLGQARAVERGSRSIVYLKDPSEYSGGDVELLGKGYTPEGLAKSWAAKMLR